MTKRFEQETHIGFYVAITLLIAAVFAADLLTKLGIAVWVFYLIPMLLCSFIWSPGVPILAAVACSVLLFAGYFLAPPSALAPWVSHTNRSFGLVIIWTIGLLARQTILSKLSLKKRDWLRNAQTGLAERVLGEQTLLELGESILQFLAPYLDAQVGVLYALGDDQRLIRSASYALGADWKTSHQSFALGEGLVGQAAAQKKTLSVQKLPEGYLKISSALGAQVPRDLIIAPVTANEQVAGVIELGFFRRTDASDKELLDLLAEPIGIALRTSLYRIRQLERLLKETQRQAEALQVQQEELRVSNEELEEQSIALRESQAKLEVQQAELEQTNVQLEEQTQTLERQKSRLTRAQGELSAKAAELQRSNQYKSEFLANMSHELRTPLNSALILAKLLADNKGQNLSEEQVKFARSIYSAGNDLLDLINDILDLSKIEAGKVEVHPEEIDLARLLSSLTQTFQPLASQKQIGFVARIEEGAPERIESDPQRLSQILKNLLSNAVKFTERGEVTLLISPSEGGGVCFAVRDTGVGIEPSQHTSIFEAFRQADGTTNRKYGGTGLGLSISKELAHLLGARIELESAPGQGSTFRLFVPGTLQEAKAAPVLSQRSPLGAPRKAAAALLAESPSSPKARPKPAAAQDDRASITDERRVLLAIEDDPTFAKILYDLAHELNFHCLLAETADEGMELALQYRPAAIILDIKLPDHTGLSVLDRLKHNSTTRHIPVQVISSFDYTQTALKMGAVGYMLKPVKREELVEALSKLETRFSQGLRSVLVVEDNALQRESICRLLDAKDVRTVPVETAAAALEELKRATFDCMVLDLSLPDESGFALLEKMAKEEVYSFPPVIIYTARALSSEEEQRLRRYSKSIIIKGAKSPERLLDEVTLFLHQVEDVLPPDRQRMLREARDREATFEDRRILVVEDDVRNIFALSSLLEPKGVKLEIARNGKEALGLLAQAKRIDLVLMDIMMPEMDGYQAMREIRKRPHLSELPIIALTAKAMPDDQRRCLDAGANDYIAKPIDVEKLLSLIRIWLPK